MDQRYWVKYGKGDRAQAYWSDGEFSLIVAGDRIEVTRLIESVAAERGCELPDPDTSGPIPVMPGQLELV